MAFKPIQKGIPTILLNGYGQTGLFYDYMGLVDLDTQIIFDEVEPNPSIETTEKIILKYQNLDLL
mgnify:CR=1 FL=1